jgi:hypothetical protein
MEMKHASPGVIYQRERPDEYCRDTCALRAGNSKGTVDMIRLPAVALVVMMAALSSHSDAKSMSGPTDATLQDEFAAQQATPMAVAQKVCVIIGPGSPTDSGYVSVTPVPSTWTIATCQALAAGGRQRWMLGCFFANSFSFGAGGASRPSPNCGWK